MAKNTDVEPVYIPEGYYYSTNQVARVMHVNQSTVHNWIKKGWLPVVRSGVHGYFISREALAKFDPPTWGPRFKTRAANEPRGAQAPNIVNQEPEEG